jgi:hypothetical protein
LFNLNMVSTKHQAGFIPNSNRGLPRPWLRIPMHMAVGDGWLGDSRHAHWGGQGEVYIAFEWGGVDNFPLGLVAETIWVKGRRNTATPFSCVGGAFELFGQNSYSCYFKGL